MSLISKQNKSFVNDAKKHGSLEISEELLNNPLYVYRIDSSIFKEAIDRTFTQPNPTLFEVGGDWQVLTYQDLPGGKIVIEESQDGAVITNTIFEFLVNDFPEGVTSQTWQIRIQVERFGEVVDTIYPENEFEIFADSTDRAISVGFEEGVKIGEDGIFKVGDEFFAEARMIAVDFESDSVIFESRGHTTSGTSDSFGTRSIFPSFNNQQTITDIFDAAVYKTNLNNNGLQLEITQNMFDFLTLAGSDLRISGDVGVKRFKTSLGIGDGSYTFGFRLDKFSGTDSWITSTVRINYSTTQSGNNDSTTQNGILSLEDIEVGDLIYPAGLVDNFRGDFFLRQHDNSSNQGFKVETTIDLQRIGTLVSGFAFYETTKPLAKFGNNIDDMLEYAKSIAEGGVIILPLIQDDSIPQGIIRAMATGVNSPVSQNLQDTDAFLTQNESRTYLAKDRVDVADKVPRFISFNDIFTDGTLVPDTDIEEEEVFVPGQYVIKNTQFYSISDVKTNQNIDGTDSNYEYSLRRFNSYQLTNSEDKKIKIIFTMGSRKPEPYRYYQLTFKDFLLLKQLKFSAVNNIPYNVIWDKKIENNVLVDNNTDWNFLYGWNQLNGNVYDWTSPWIGEHRFINNTYELTSGITDWTKKSGRDSIENVFTIPGESNYVFRDFVSGRGSVSGGISRESKETLIGALIGEGEIPPAGVPFINNKGLGLNNTTSRQQELIPEVEAPWKANSGRYNNELLFYDPRGTVLPTLPTQVWYSKSSPNVQLSKIDYDSSKQRLLEGQLIFNGIDYSNSNWIDTGDEIKEILKSPSNYFDFTNNPEDASYMMLMPATIEQLERTMEDPDFGILSRVGTIRYDLSGKIPIANPRVGFMNITDPTTVQINTIKNSSFFRKSLLSGEHTILIDFGGNVDISVEDLEYYGGSERLIQRFKDLGNGVIEQAKDVNGRQLPNQYLPVVQKRRNNRVGRERVIAI